MMRRKWNRRLTGVALALFIGMGINTTEAEPAWSINAKNVIAIKDTKALDIELVYENIRHASSSIADLSSMEEEMDGQALREMIAAYALPTGELFSRGKVVTEEAKQSLLDNRNLSPIGKMQPVGYGVAVRRANVKALPTGGGLFTAEDDVEGDVLQQGALDPCEPVRLLHVSTDRRYYFVQGAALRGWVFIGDIAVAKKSWWQSFAEPTQFLVVTSRGERIKQANETVYAQMGARLPLRNEDDKQYKIIMPVRGNHGKLIEAETLIDKKDSFAVGYLDYTEENITKLASAYVGAPYGHRGLKNSEDSSGMIADIYRAMGITLPQKASELRSAAAVLPPCGNIEIMETTDGDNLLVLASSGEGISVVGRSADGKQIAAYTIAETSEEAAE